MRHQGTLPAQYTQRLEEMSLDEIAIEAAHLRSDGRLCGTSTALILRWLRRTSPADFEIFMALYRDAWQAEKSARIEGKSRRPADRPVKGGRRVRNSRDRHGFVALSY